MGAVGGREMGGWLPLSNKLLKRRSVTDKCRVDTCPCLNVCLHPAFVCFVGRDV